MSETEATTIDLLIIQLGATTYGVPVDTIESIIADDGRTEITGAPGHVLGIIDVRGRLLPLVDLSVLLGGPRCEPDGKVLIAPGHKSAVGFKVDAVSEVAMIEPADIEERPLALNMVSWVSGVIRNGGQVVAILDLSGLIDDVEAA
jgi:purine-binding chemotaxis protein CheW